ncbi:SRPBCC domain-containing protein [Streptomyces yatensis]|uniref:SRPBCC family protein n=1 Tax=Streptomyces yatensis TaxID=155177 RepID=A0ABN2I577_9ACTN|nr:SRPBCC domain-containing protein [Streptomyces yatensis]
MTVTHTTFDLERVYPAKPPRVFAAWADPAAKARWFGSGGSHELDFRAGGRELIRGRTPDGKELAFTSVYHDIVPDQRIVYSSTLTADDTLATVSTTTIELTAEGEGTRLTLTEQATFLDGREEPSWRKQGTSDWLATLGEELRA